jgi:O-antigen/teichoic acid export membrane protein
VINKIFSTFSIKLASAIFNLLIAIVVSRYLGAAGKGEQSLVLTTISFILIFENIAGGAVLVYLGSRFKTSVLISLSYLWSVLIGIAFYFILLQFEIVKTEFVFAVCLLSVINSFAANNANILLGKEKINSSNWVNFIQPFFTLISLLFFVVSYKETSVYSYINSLYIAYISAFFLSLFLLFKANVGDNTSKENSWLLTLKTMFALGFYNQLSHITSLLNMRLSYYLLEKYQSTETLGIYSNGVSLTEAIWMVSGSMAMVQYSKIANSDNKQYSQQLTVNMTKISLLVTVVILIPMLLLPSAFYSFIFGKDFTNINHIMICLAPGVVFYNFALLIGHYFSGTGRYYINTTASAAGLFITLILSFVAIPMWGFYGAALVSSVSYIVVSATVIIFFYKESKIGFSQMIPDKNDLKLYFLEIKNFVNKKHLSDE